MAVFAPISHILKVDCVPILFECQIFTHPSDKQKEGDDSLLVRDCLPALL
jgi:hypothetical protein